MAAPPLYPPNPHDVPGDLTTASPQFRTQTLLMLGALTVFFGLYFGLILFCFVYPLAAFWLLCSDLGGEGAMLFRALPMLLTPVCVLGFIYLTKNLLKLQRAERPALLELFPEEHPRLFDFIDRVCADVGADTPRHVYVDHSVNAAAMLDTTSFFHLFVPTRRSLLIGLGLVNAINLTEFKALLAHEFGHFSQKSTRLAAYTHVVRLIVFHVIRGDDLFDRFILAWSELHPFLAWPALFVRAMQWLFQRGLSLMYYAIFFFDRGMSRQEEFNADLIAVSVTGSDAPVHLLYRSNFADVCLALVAQDLALARDHHLYSSDVFHHQRAAVDILRRRDKNPLLGEPPALPADPFKPTQVFQNDEDDMAAMWQSHPSYFDRERNAKARYIRSSFDERSPWILFDNVDELRERITVHFYRTFFKLPKDVILADPAEVQGFIEDEHADRIYHPKYHGLYDQRGLFSSFSARREAPDVSLRALNEDPPWSITDLARTHRTLYGDDVKERAEAFNRRVAELQLLNAIDNGWHRPKNDELEFRGDTYDTNDTRGLMRQVEKEMKADQQWLDALDRKVFVTYCQMARCIDPAVADELFRRYDFHLQLQRLWQGLHKHEQPVSAALAFLQTQDSQLAPHHFRKVLEIFRDAHRAMKHTLQSAEAMTLPALKNLPQGQPLRPFLLQKRLVDGVSKYERTITKEWRTKVINQFREMKDKADRIHFKSLAGILALQERIGEECLARWQNLPSVEPT